MQRTAGAFRLALLIERGRFRRGSRVQPDHRVEDGALLIVVRDPVQVHADQRFGRDASGREAEVLASLNHPNIAAIHGLEESGGITALVMELVEGDDLSLRIARGSVLRVTRGGC